MLVDPQPRRLAVGNQTHAIKACMPHQLDNLIRGERQHVPPIAGKLDRRGQQRDTWLDRGRQNDHVGFSSLAIVSVGTATC
jgi:hypothetical protein